MKYLSFIPGFFLFFLFAAPAQGQENQGGNPEMKAAAAEVTDVFMVYGNCGMCEKRIERTALSLEGVRSADWDTGTKMLTVTYDAAATSQDVIKEKIASVGHDTDKFRAPKEVYDNLPGCCQYERPEEN